MTNPNYPEPTSSPDNIAEAAQILAAGYLRLRFGNDQSSAHEQIRTDGGDN